jgi:hypothetical protein
MFWLARLPARIRQAPGLVYEPTRAAGGRVMGAPEETMKFMLIFSIKPEAKGRDEAIARFKATGGQPPKGVKLLGRWTAADFSGGFDLLDSDDVKALTEFSLMWSDVMELKIVPVIEDADLGEVLSRQRK